MASGFDTAASETDHRVSSAIDHTRAPAATRIKLLHRSRFVLPLRGSRPAEGHLRRCLVVGRHSGEGSCSKGASGPRVARGQAARSRHRVDAALSPGVTIPGSSGSPLPVTGAVPGRATRPADGLARPPGPFGRSARQRLRLSRAEARGTGTKAPRRGVPRPVRCDGGWPCPCPVLFRARPSAPRTARPPRSPSLSRAARPARPSCLGPGKGRENDPARPNGKEISMTRALSEPLNRPGPPGGRGRRGSSAGGRRCAG